MQVSIEQQASVLSMEAFNFQASLTALTQVFPNYVAKVKAALNSYANNDVGGIAIVECTSTLKAIKNINYAAHRKTFIYGPAGLQVSYLDYLAAIEGSVAITEDFHQLQVRSFLNWLTALLGTPEELSSIHGIKCPIKYGDKDLDAQRTALAKCVNKASHQTMFEYGKLVRQNGDWENIVEKTNNLSTRYLKTNRKEILVDIEYITEALETLVTRVKEDPAMYKISGVTLAELSKQCLIVARTVEFYSITGFLVAEMAGSVAETMKGVQRLV